MEEKLGLRRSEGGIAFNIYLPELTDDFTGDEPTPEMVERAVEALKAALPQRVEIYLDGEDKPPAVVEIDPWDVEDESEWGLEG